MTLETSKTTKSPGKAITISARIAQEDAEFLAKYKVSGAVTPSDKLRAILAEARGRHQRLKDFRGSIDMFQEMLAPVTAQIRELELKNHMHSELITRILEWLPDMMAYVVASEARLNQSTDKQGLMDIEEALADRVFRLIESVMQMGITRRCPCYKSNAISSRMEPILDIAQVISR